MPLRRVNAFATATKVEKLIKHKFFGNGLRGSFGRMFSSMTENAPGDKKHRSTGKKSPRPLHFSGPGDRTVPRMVSDGTASTPRQTFFGVPEKRRSFSGTQARHFESPEMM